MTQIAWSPKQNLLGWTDTEGNLTRHHDVVPASLPGPVKQSSATGVVGNTVKRTASLSLFDDAADVDRDKKGGMDADEDIDLDVDMGDFLDDDLGDYLKDDEEAERKHIGSRVEVGAHCPCLAQNPDVYNEPQQSILPKHNPRFNRVPPQWTPLNESVY